MINNWNIKTISNKNFSKITCLMIFFLLIGTFSFGVSGDTECGDSSLSFDKLDDMENKMDHKNMMLSLSSDGLMDSAWPMFQHDPQHTGRTDVILPSGNQGVLKWKYLLLESVKESTPVIDKDGTIYVGDSAHHINAVYPNGTLKWKYKLGSRTKETAAIAADGTIYMGIYGGELYAVNPNGTIKWELTLTEIDIESSPVIGEDGTIYIGCDYDKRLFAVNPNGTIKWDFKTDGAMSSPALDTDGNIYIGSGDGFFYCIYPNGTLRWKTEFGFPCGGQGAVIDDETVYFTGGGSLSAMYAENGTLKWWYASGYWSSSGSPALGFDGELYFGCGIIGTDESGAFVCVNPNGTLRWSRPTVEYCISSPVVTGGGVIIVGDHDGFVYAFSTEGELLWRYFTANQIYSSFAIADDGTIYFTCWDGCLYALEVVERVNHPPDTPTIEGPTRMKVSTQCPYNISLSDPDGDLLFYKIKFGGQNYTLWEGPKESGTQAIEEIGWMFPGIYNLQVKARDEHGYESNWATLEVTVPKNKAINTPFLQFLENHPHMFPLLRHLMRL